MSAKAYVDLYWLPLGAGGRWVRLNGRAYERLVAWLAGRAPCDLYHSALEVRVGNERFVIEMTPAWGNADADRGVVAVGPVGMPWLGRSRLFRYEVRRWRGGRIPDVAEAVESPRRLSSDESMAGRVLALAPEFPTYTWGLDEQGTGEMWNSNSLVSWLLVCSGVDVSDAQPPAGGRAPGWNAGAVVAHRVGDPGASPTRRRAPRLRSAMVESPAGRGFRHERPQSVGDTPKDQRSGVAHRSSRRSPS